MNLRRALLAAFALAALALLAAGARACVLPAERRRRRPGGADRRAPRHREASRSTAPSTAPTATSRFARASRSTGSPSPRGTDATPAAAAPKLGSIDRSDTFNYETNDKRVRIVWHFLAAGEPRTYTISYRFEGLTVAYDDVVDVNLKVWGAELVRAAPEPDRSRPAAPAGRARAELPRLRAIRRG